MPDSGEIRDARGLFGLIDQHERVFQLLPDRRQPVPFHQHDVDTASKCIAAEIGEFLRTRRPIRRPRNLAERFAGTYRRLRKDFPEERPHHAKRRMNVYDASGVGAAPVDGEMQRQFARHALRRIARRTVYVDAHDVVRLQTAQTPARRRRQYVAVVESHAYVAARSADQAAIPQTLRVRDDCRACFLLAHRPATYDARAVAPSGEPGRVDLPKLGRVVIAEPFDERGVAVLSRAGIEVVSCVGSSLDALHSALGDARGLIVRSETRVDGELLSRAPQLEVVARAGVGVDAIDVDAATAAGIVVVNTPSANTIAATEHTFAVLLATLRHVPAAHASIRESRWERKPFVGNELYGKTLGIVGLGRIGSNVASRAAAFGMTVIAHDPYLPASRASALGVELVELERLLSTADVITLHVPLTPQTRSLIDARALSLVKPSAVLVNCARGAVVDVAALIDALDAQRLAAAAVDVVPDEPPPPGSPSARILAHPRVVATPHLGGSTYEALERIALELAEDVVRVLGGRPASGAVNAPTLAGGAQAAGGFVDLAFRMGAMVPQLFDDALRREVALVLHGDISELDAEPFVAAALAGALPFMSDRRVSIVNATTIARDVGIRTMVLREGPHGPFRASLAITVEEHRLVGTVLHNGPRIVEIDGFEVDAIADGTMLVTRHRDVPGMVGRIGTILGNANINISTMQVARSERGGGAMMVLDVDRELDRQALATIAAADGIESVRLVQV